MRPTIITLPLTTLASGDRLFLQVYEFTGRQPGQTVYLQSNLHGAEIAGNAVIHELIEFFRGLDETQLQGTVRLLPMCNPVGVNQRSHQFASGRFNPYDGKDWNRIFWDYEKEGDDLLEFAQIHLNLDVPTIQRHYRQRIQEHFEAAAAAVQSPAGLPFGDRYRYLLQRLCRDADYLIDLHSSSNQGLTYLYYFRDRDDSAKFFLLPAGILLDEYDGDAFDEAFMKPWLALETCFAKLGRPIRFEVEAWTLELGSGMQVDADAVAKGVRGIKNYLVQKGVLAIANYPVEQPSYHDMRFTTSSKVTRYYAPTGGIVQTRAPLGSLVEPEQPIYELLTFNRQGELPSVVKVLAGQGGLVFDLATNQAVNEGEYVLGIL
ncbi:MAG: succinylglutamate desuccinylase/aspartoacylase family protein [Synechococcales bacterium]|nr:succinylglutamate desuccinylase/aspartoacylase family protein [Synechococcales bacterium]